ncbi:MAG: FAD-linked oxidase C-terminal domain-containing protein, partial [Pseudomonadota bacterium]
MVREYKGSHSGEHGDGLVRSEFHRPMFGDRMVENFEWVKDRFDHKGLLNPGKIVRPPKMDDRKLLRYGPSYDVKDMNAVFNWPDHYGKGRGLQGAVEMCNNNGASGQMRECGMCPSYRVTKDERDVVRGRANALRLALSGQLGPDALSSDAMADTMSLCVSCKACRRECPTGVDMAKMKIEVLAKRAETKGLSIRDRLVAYLPRYASWASQVPWAFNARDAIPGMAFLSEKLIGLSDKRSLPKWRSDAFQTKQMETQAGTTQPDVLLFADTFNRYFEPDNLHAAETVLKAAGINYAHATPTSERETRPLCCGRTFFSAGLVDEARSELTRTIKVFRPVLEAGGYVVGLEPSCVMTFRDEAPALLGDDWNADLGSRVLTLEEYLAMRHQSGELKLSLKPIAAKKALLHGHCHQKSFNAVTPIQTLLALIPELETEVVQTSCCGMAGAFGYQAETYETSIAMAELNLLPKVREADADTVILADGTSCRHQISDGTQRSAIHVAQLLADAIDHSAQRQ